MFRKMSTCNFVRKENSLSDSEILCDLVNNDIVSQSDSVLKFNDIPNNENSSSISEILCDSDNENLSKSGGKIKVNDGNSSCYADSGLSFTTSPVVLYLRPEDQNNEDSSMDVLQDTSALKQDSQDAKRPFSCDLCDKTFKRRSHYNIHLHTHKTEKPYKCKTCNKAFTHHYFLKGHEAIHNTVKQFTCNICNQEFSVRRYYSRHMRRHVKTTYECDACDFWCNSLKESNRHVKSHDANISICEKCNRFFCQEISLNLHHCFESDKKKFFCKLCGKAFKRVSDLDLHIAKHENKKSFVCDICKLGFNVKASLDVHKQWVHDEENPVKPYSCEKCDKKFHLQVNLKRHEQVHKKKQQSSKTDCVSENQSRINQSQSGTKVGYLYLDSPVPMKQLVYYIPGKKVNYVCGICLKGFRYRFNFDVHYRRHTGEKPHECNICSKRFADKSDLTRHYRIHTGDRKYSCDFCHKTFTRKAYVRNHLQICINRGKFPKITSVFTVNEESM